MKRILIVVTLFAMALGIAAQDLRFSIRDVIQNQVVRQRAEYGITRLLNEFNYACAQQRPLQLDSIDMTQSGKRSLQALWQNLHFSCGDGEIAERCLTSTEGFVIRNINVEVNPMIEGYNDEKERTLAIGLTRLGQIASVSIAVSDSIYRRVIELSLSALDLERRATLLNFVENYRSYYDTKDLSSIERIFSDDAIVISHSGFLQRVFADDSEARHNGANDMFYRDLAKIFNRNGFINATISGVEVMRHPSNHNFYGLSIYQQLKSSIYEDDGYLLLVWEFRDGEDPVIHYRTWQPDEFHTLQQNELLNILNFPIPSE